MELVGHGLSDYGSYGGGGIGHGLYEGHVQHHYAPAVPVSQHVELTKPVPVPVVKNVGKLIILISIDRRILVCVIRKVEIVIVLVSEIRTHSFQVSNAIVYLTK